MRHPLRITFTHTNHLLKIIQRRASSVIHINKDLRLLRYAPTRSEIFLLGTDHSENSDSISTTRELMDIVKPTAVGVELCLERMALLQMPGFSPSLPCLSIPSIQKQDNSKGAYGWTTRYLVQKAVELKSQQKEEELEDEDEEYDYENGGELMEAHSYAKKERIPLLLLDRPLSLTAGRLIKYWFSFIRFFFDNSRGTVKFQKYPAIEEILLHSRDEYMTAHIIAYLFSQPHPQRMVIVVGKNHLSGIEAQWKLNTASFGEENE